MKTKKSNIKIKEDVRYFVTSLDKTEKELLSRIRSQWDIENKLHWILDVSLGEDGNRTRNKIAAENLTLVRKIAINLVKQDKVNKFGVKTKLKMAGWDEKYLEELLFKTRLS